MNIYKEILSRDKKRVAILIDPDNNSPESLDRIVHNCNESHVDYIFVGGSLVVTNIAETIGRIKEQTSIPVLIFPGNVIQISELADGILYLSLISGRNPEYLIGQHVVSAPGLKKSGIEVIPTAYILIENGKTTSVEYMSNTIPIPADKPEIVVATALAGEMLGMKLIYLEAGSGAAKSVSLKIISEVKANTGIPILVGGGIRSREDAVMIFSHGADLIVVGSAVEENPDIIQEICDAR
ncbi:MAG: geranylgeranylglyceryl/heptaprenylglyceryl phosphate synthase [Bacteroidales bacterium]|nr:geranylgeranylglyceryl/heptaprenylglyceryl phosphate synthase [Bacteroidales bacterium]MCB8999270.1 geranylgeranylglyceryl/heptaprenylglyceryl phosphate synthase [Bacteroidales bacterium]MCB9013062.1 geranylgeranylglyceryl/heptaprenylglyceryl phosphate synthase [Bacteroidales bacterium]